MSPKPALLEFRSNRDCLLDSSEFTAFGPSGYRRGHVRHCNRQPCLFFDFTDVLLVRSSPPTTMEQCPMHGDLFDLEPHGSMWLGAPNPSYRRTRMARFRLRPPDSALNLRSRFETVAYSRALSSNTMYSVSAYFSPSFMALGSHPKDRNPSD